MNSVIVFPRGQLTPKDKERMSKAGIVAVEADDPSKVVQVLPVAPAALPIAADDMFMSALWAVNSAETRKTPEDFVRELWRRSRAREEVMKEQKNG